MLLCLKGLDGKPNFFLLLQYSSCRVCDIKEFLLWYFSMEALLGHLSHVMDFVWQMCILGGGGLP